MLTIYTDGGSRGNPGNAACAFVVYDEGVEVKRDSKFLGHATNNFAEYNGVLLALEWIKEGSSVNFFLDSELVVKQLTGIYKIKNSVIQNLVLQIKKIIHDKQIFAEFNNVPREKNKTADLLVNKELDRSEKNFG